MTQAENDNNSHKAFIDGCLAEMKENAERNAQNIDLKFGATYLIDRNTWRISLSDLRGMSFSEPLQAEFDEWYEKQTKRGLIDASYTIPTLNKERFEDAVREFLSIEKAVENGQITRPPEPLSETPDFINNILSKSLISGKPGL